MLRPCLILCALVACGLASAWADTIQLKDKAAVVGTVLAEKPDQIVVDVGYTVLVIPRNQVVKIVKGDTPAAPASKPRRGQKTAPVSDATEVAQPKPGFYLAPNKAAAICSVRDLVNEIGEAVVPVRTPSGL